MNEMHSLQHCLEHSNKIASNRRKYVFSILTFYHGITDWDDLVGWTPNYKHTMYGLSKKEVMALEELRKDELLVRKSSEMGKMELQNKLIKCTSASSKGEAIRTYNILIANGITNIRLFAAYSNDQLKALKGIGPVRFEIIKRAKYGK